MNERIYRLFQGGLILLGLILESDMVIYIFVGLTFFEGLTGILMPDLLPKKTRGSELGINSKDSTVASINFKAERLMRLTAVILLSISYFGFPEETWFFPWFMGSVLIMAGLTSVCPMVIFYRWAGFR